mmetsp:Transcript_5589/g.21023  ORF Transcript_5589/g.21023 Transcript_5589/m.21023 type:complete len:119 (+) Transcript_5589:3-359(+)
MTSPLLLSSPKRSPSKLLTYGSANGSTSFSLQSQRESQKGAKPKDTANIPLSPRTNENEGSHACNSPPSPKKERQVALSPTNRSLEAKTDSYKKHSFKLQTIGQNLSSLLEDLEQMRK